MRKIFLLSLICLLFFLSCKDGNDEIIDRGTTRNTNINLASVIGKKFSYSIDSTFSYDEMGIDITVPVRGGTYEFRDTNKYSLNEWKTFNGFRYNYVEKGTFKINKQNISFKVEYQKGDSGFVYKQSTYDAFLRDSDNLIYNNQIYNYSNKR